MAVVSPVLPAHKHEASSLLVRCQSLYCSYFQPQNKDGFTIMPDSVCLSLDKESLEILESKLLYYVYCSKRTLHGVVFIHILN